MTENPCSICFEELDKTTYITSCNHCFHYKCIYNYAIHTHFVTRCPLCLKERIFTNKDIRPRGLCLRETLHILALCSALYISIAIIILIVIIIVS